MNWLILVFAGLLETVWAVGLKYTEGFSRLWPTVGVLVVMAGSVWLLSVAMRELPVGTAYAVWTGIGACGAVLVGIFLFGEPVTLARVGCLFLILSGVIGLKVFA